MLDIQFIRDHADTVRKAARDKNLNPKVVDEVLRFDAKRRELRAKVEQLRAERNAISKEMAIKKSANLQEQAAEIKKTLKDIEPQLKKTEAGFSELMLQVPSVPAPDVPVGSDDSEN